MPGFPKRKKERKKIINRKVVLAEIIVDLHAIEKGNTTRLSKKGIMSHYAMTSFHKVPPQDFLQLMRFPTSQDDV